MKHGATTEAVRRADAIAVQLRHVPEERLGTAVREIISMELELTGIRYSVYELPTTHEVFIVGHRSAKPSWNTLRRAILTTMVKT